MKVLVTGGAGYIGSHTALALLQDGHDVIVLDNLCNGSLDSVARVKKLAEKNVEFFKGDIRDTNLLRELFEHYSIDSVIHFAGLKAVGESTQVPLAYYNNNVSGTLVLLDAMKKAEVSKLVFSSSATIYGENAPVPYIEEYSRGAASSPYGATKGVVEQVLEDLAASDSGWAFTALRYFNPIGAHESGLLGEDPKGVPNNLMPFISQVAVGRRDQLSIFGDDYPTPDGTCRRDYLHVMDLAEGHVSALENLVSGFDAINLGTGQPVSVLEMVKAFERVNGVSIPFEVVDRRIGDLPEFWANVDKAKAQLGWEAKRTLDQMMADTWRWQSKNPNGYS